MTIETREDRLQRRIAHLYDTDAQFADARPSDAVNAAVAQPDLRLPAVVKGIFAGYADRPALGQRAVEYVTDAAGRTSAQLLPRFETITYRQLGDRVQAVTNAWHNHPVKPGDRVAILGFTSVDYTTIDTALIELGAVSVPLQTSAPVTTLRPIVAETEPTVIAASIDFLDDAVELVRSGPAPRRLVVFDYRPQVDAQREAFEAAKSTLAGTDVVVEPLADVLDRGRSLADAPLYTPGQADPLTMLIYTSGSTGTPKGAMYPESKVANMWQLASKATWDENQAVLPAITLNFMPMSHVMGRGILIGTLSSGGTAYFAARSDLSTFLDDLALVRPTQLSFVPRIWDMLFGEYQSRLDRSGGSEDAVLAEVREDLLGGRFVSAMTGSAPISAEMKAWVERLLDMHLLEGYGSTEAGSVFVDGYIQRPPVIDYKLVDVPDLGYFRTDQPHPRGELLVKSEQMFPGYYKRPEITAEMFDEDGYYRTGDIVAELGPDHVEYLDRRNNVLKLSQGEFVTVSKLEAVFGDSPLVRQIFIYGNSARSYLLAVVVPTDLGASKPEINDSLQDAARAAGLQSYEVPRDFIVETTPFSLENGLLTGIRKLARPNLKAHYGERLEQLYTELAEGQATS